MAKSYRVGIVGESNYQRAIAGLREGEIVRLHHEPDNPHDPRAVAVADGDGERIGYLPREHWLTEALLDQGKKARATVGDLRKGDKATGVVLDVELFDAEEAEALAASPPRGSRNRLRGCGTTILTIGGVILALALISSLVEPSPPDLGTPESAPLAASTVKQCRDLIAKGREIGVIKARPSPNRLDVDDGTWAALPAETKDQLMQAVSCDLWQKAMPPSSEHVVAYGYRSGKRIQMLTSVGMSRE